METIDSRDCWNCGEFEHLGWYYGYERQRKLFCFGCRKLRLLKPQMECWKLAKAARATITNLGPRPKNSVPASSSPQQPYQRSVSLLSCFDPRQRFTKLNIGKLLSTEQFSGAIFRHWRNYMVKFTPFVEVLVLGYLSLRGWLQPTWVLISAILQLRQVITIDHHSQIFCLEFWTMRLTTGIMILFCFCN